TRMTTWMNTKARCTNSHSF
ncbi:sensory transduction protein kinase, partial [Vibrio harveyi]